MFHMNHRANLHLFQGIKGIKGGFAPKKRISPLGSSYGFPSVPRQRGLPESILLQRQEKTPYFIVASRYF